MNSTDPLLTTLLDLLYELRDADFPLVLGGGYGLYLRQARLQESGEPSLLEAIPPLRATNDLDVFLHTEVITDSERLRPLRDALDRLGFKVIPSAQNYQFARKFTLAGQDWDIKIDLLAKTPDRSVFPHIKVDERRVRPHPSVGLHAHRTDEAIAIEDNMTTVTVTGLRSSGDLYTGKISLPSSYASLMMKLYALRDQWESAEKGFGRKHAIDLYTLIALMTEPEYHTSQELSRRYQVTAEGREAGRITGALFRDDSGMGVLRMKEHGTLPANADIAAFVTILQELFPEAAKATS
jgi:hypothetical protein